MTEAWSHAVYEDSDGTYRVEVTDESGATLPVARRVTRGQAGLLIQRIRAEAEACAKPVSDVIRDPWFMAATIVTVKRQPA